MNNTVIIIGNGFDLDLGINLSFKEWRKSHHCLSYEFSHEHPKGELWNDFEKMLRNLILDYNAENCVNNELAEAINHYWQGFWKYLSLFFSEVTKDFPDINSVNENCAFEVLKSLNESSCVYTFNYTYPYEYTNLPEKCQFNFVHGRYYKDYFVGMSPIMLQSGNMIVGVDYKRMPVSIREDHYISPIIKKQNPHFVNSFIEDALLSAETVIFFGHSLGITDSDYFDEFFTTIGTNRCKRIYFVTFNQESFDAIKKSSSEWGVNWKRIYQSEIQIIPIFTSLGKEQDSFQEMLTLI